MLYILIQCLIVDLINTDSPSPDSRLHERWDPCLYLLTILFLVPNTEPGT